MDGFVLAVSSHGRKREFWCLFNLFINIRVVNAIMRVPPSWHHLNLITSQSPHIKYHHFGNEDFNIWTLGGHKHSVSSTCFLIHEALTEVLSSAHLGKKSDLLFLHGRPKINYDPSFYLYSFQSGYMGNSIFHITFSYSKFPLSRPKKKSKQKAKDILQSLFIGFSVQNNLLVLSPFQCYLRNLGHV